MVDVRNIIRNQLFSHELVSFKKKHTNNTAPKPLVLIWEFGGFPAIGRRNAIHSLALDVRGYETEFIFCDGSAKACIKRDIRKSSPKFWSSACIECSHAMIAEAKKYNMN